MTTEEMQAEITRLHYEMDAIPAIKEERDALLAAGKLAVDALDDWYYGANQDRPKAAVYVALQALKAAGVS